MSKYVAPAPGKFVEYKADIIRNAFCGDEYVIVSKFACWKLMESKGVVPAGVSAFLEKLKEELDEVIDAWISVIASGQDLDEARAHLEHELGDLTHTLGTTCEEMRREGLVLSTLPEMLRAAHERNNGRTWK